MNTVLQLQKLNPTANREEMNGMFISTYSNICPTTSLTAEHNPFQME
jgi:hypothetical protein